MSNFWKIIAAFISIALFIIFLFWNFFAAPSKSKETITFIVPQNIQDFNLTDSLYENNLVKNKDATNFLLFNIFEKFELIPGGYKLSRNLNAWELLKKMQKKPDMVWINIYYCPRKEQVGEKLAAALGWNQTQLDEWNNLFKNTDYFEGVYYPDTYLIPTNESVEQVAKRFINNFETKFEPLSKESLSKNIKWDTALKVASLIAREAAGRDDSKLISGIIWKRLNQNMRLQIDATMQYTLGKNDNGSWWGNISLEEKRNDSPYNSYEHEGLPPTPICSPNIDFIEAALNPEQTECIFYIHDSNRQIHCAKTYNEHKENIKKYL